MSFKTVGFSLITLGVMIIASQVATIVVPFAFKECVDSGLSWSGAAFLKFDYPDKLVAGIWGGFLIMLGGAMAMSRRSGFKIFAVISLLCGAAISGLYVWGLQRIWDYREESGSWEKCTSTVQWIFIIRTILAVLGLQVVAVSIALLFKKPKRHTKFAPQYASAPIYTPPSVRQSEDDMSTRTLDKSSLV